MSAQVPDRADDSSASWAARNLPVVAAVMMRVLREPALAFDLTTELLAIAALRWDRYRAEESRTAWVLAFGGQLLARALESDRVPCDERMRNRPWLGPHTLSDEQVDWLRRLVDEPLDLAHDARRIVARLEREAPPPSRVRRMRLSSLVRLESRVHDGA